MPENYLVRGHKNPVKGEQAMRLRREQTPAEARLWRFVRANRLAGKHFRRQHVLAGYIVDFYCQAARLVVEVDGPVHAHQAEYDAYRSAVLKGMGQTVLRFSNEQVERELPHVLATIRAALSDPSASGTKGPRPDLL